MQCVRRAGDRRTWAWRKPWPSSPRIAFAGTRRPLKRTTPWPPGKQVSSVSRLRSMWMPGALISARNIVAPAPGTIAMMMASVAPSAPVVNHLRPLMT